MAYDHRTDFVDLSSSSDGSLLDLLDRILDHGVVLVGDLRVSVAGVDLLFVGLKALICSIEKAESYRDHHRVLNRDDEAVDPSPDALEAM